MERQAKYQDKILKFLPRAVSVVTFHQSLPFSPSKEKRFSGPIVSMIPYEARRKPKKNGQEEVEVEEEPTSPKVSCIGQIKHKHKKIISEKKKIISEKKKLKKRSGSATIKDSKPVTWSPREVKKHALSIKRMFSSNTIKPGRKSDASCADHDHHHHHHHNNRKPPLPDRAPSLSQMKRFASGRDSFLNFDWGADHDDQVLTPDADYRNITRYSDDREESDEEQEVMIPFSAPMTVGREVPLQPRKEINLWKRRTMAPPRPLELNTMMIRAN
ncbi:hypothetical protein L484_014311 [Morus notabilis]|uniref:Uncharacterized protein n=1 Tax=Morus notabilis TaxID=981085 RepID=W9RK33_9ROSA|nr:uncharacterized protein At1g76070 [Morus notabilis]EXB81503.1 hypothetical protein L484_014311 [Morus notabilis]